MGEFEGKLGTTSSEIRERVFSRLRPYCIELLELTRNPRKNSSFFAEMADFLRRAPAAGLQQCLDYTLFPLLLLLDAAVQCRSEKKASSSGGFGAPDSPFSGQVISDSVAEGTLRCLEELLRKCHLGSVNQMVAVLKKITSGALLSPSEASEEIREGIIKCLKAMLLRLQPCSFGSCSCKEIFIFPTLVTTLEHCLPSSSCYEEPQECLLSFLQSKDASAAVGHWLSLLLQAAEAEAARGHRGSATLRKEAFLTLRVLVAKVGTADALAFFLPGIVSRFTKSLLVTKSMISGAAGNAGSIEHAILGLTEFLIAVLRDDVNLSVLQLSTSEITCSYQNKNRSTQTILDVLRQLPARIHNQSEDSICQSALTSLKDENKMKNHDTLAGERSLYVQRTKDWVDQTSARVDKLLSAAFPHLCVHPSEKVRKALVDGTMGLLSNCIFTLQMSRLMLLIWMEALVLLCYPYTAIRHAQGIHNVEGEKDHNAYLSPELFDAHLTPLGWNQVDNLRSHVIACGLSKKIDLVITSPLLRTMQTAVGVFGGEAFVDGVKGNPLMVENAGNSGRPAISSLNGLPFIAVEACREHLGVHPCDRRRTIREYQTLFPAVDFSLIESNEDILWKPDIREPNEEVAIRGMKFINWLLTRRETEIAVITHSGFLFHTLNKIGKDFQPLIKDEICKHFANCELRSMVIVDKSLLGLGTDHFNFPGKIPRGLHLPSDIANDKHPNATVDQ